MSVLMLTLPSLSPTMEEGTLVEWKIKEGDYIESGKIIGVIATDKATVEWESLDEGFVRKIVLQQNQSAKIGDLVAVLTDEKDEDFQKELDELLKKKEEVKEETPTEEEIEEEKIEQKPTDKTSSVVASIVPAINPPDDINTEYNRKKTFVKASPAAKKEAKKRDINLAYVEPKMHPDRIVLADLEEIPDGFHHNKAENSTGLVGFVRRAEKPFFDIPLSPMRKVISQRMVQACTAVPVFQLSVAVTMDKLLELRKQLNSLENTRISINDFIVKACALALREHPNVNAAFQGEYIRRFNDVDISVAVSIEDGLITPIVRSADTKGLTFISQDVKNLVVKAKSGTLEPDEYQGGSFTISNLGMYGVDTFSAILNPPQSAILAVGGISQIVKLVDGNLQNQSICNLNLSADHRVIDGAQGAEFMNSVRKLLETPAHLIL